MNEFFRNIKLVLTKEQSEFPKANRLTRRSWPPVTSTLPVSPISMQVTLDFLWASISSESKNIEIFKKITRKIVQMRKKNLVCL